MLSWLSGSPIISNGFRLIWPQIFSQLVLLKWFCWRLTALVAGISAFAVSVWGCVQRIGGYEDPDLRWRCRSALNSPFHILDQMRSTPSCRRDWKRKHSWQFQIGTRTLLFWKHSKLSEENCWIGSFEIGLSHKRRTDHPERWKRSSGVQRRSYQFCWRCWRCLVLSSMPQGWQPHSQELHPKPCPSWRPVRNY